ncbi:aldehyde dehydrogenase 3I1 [Actinidia rufa]|uniref:Aldehyde dehydrogenase 3I1 n=1 Tax=Actinidia rufa TaxID=165716 RepID=A0A7J0EME9_9ERIC|nr:aldehyde dehydrogenase 3I1 [Actinidia rufa]
MEEFHFNEGLVPPFQCYLLNSHRAIAAGNAVVLKPSAPATSSLLAKLLEYVDNTAIRVVEGAVAETSALLEQKWDTIFYTGSGRIGRIIESAAAKHLTPVILELGGKCPAAVDSDINIEVRNSIYHTPGAMVAARRIIAGKWGCNSGEMRYDQNFGENLKESKDLSRIVNLYHFTRLSKLMDEDKVFDKIVLVGQRNETTCEKIAPSIFLDVPEDFLIMEDEIFGPLLPILTVRTLSPFFPLYLSIVSKVED